MDFPFDFWKKENDWIKKHFLEAKFDFNICKSKRERENDSIYQIIKEKTMRRQFPLIFCICAKPKKKLPTVAHFPN